MHSLVYNILQIMSSRHKGTTLKPFNKTSAKKEFALKPKITLLSTVLLLITATYPKHHVKFQYKALEMLIKGDKFIQMTEKAK